MPLFRFALPEALGPLDLLEAGLDSRAWRAAARLWRVFRASRSGTAARPARKQGAALDATEGTFHEQVKAVRLALDRDAHERADALSARLMTHLAKLPPKLALDATALRIEVLVARGDRDGALALARSQRDALKATPAGATQLEILGLGDSEIWLPGGKPNMLAIGRLIARGAIGPEELATELCRRPQHWLRNPELHLLFFMALRERDPPRALRFLNRFTEAHGLSRCRIAKRTANFLESLEFDRPPSVSDGPLVSVLVAARNAETTVPYAIDSLLRQSYERLEILVCDDRSEDRTLEVLRRRCEHEPRVRLFRSNAVQGPYNARNALAEHAGGELLALHDADDLALPERIAAQVSRLRERDVVACFSSWVRVTPEGDFVFFKNQKAVRLGLVSLMLPRAVFEQVGKFRSARIGADLELYSHLRARYGAERIARIQAPMVFGLWSSSSLTRSAGTEALADGYRSPARRSYGEMVALKYGDDGSRPSDDEIDERLRAFDNYLPPAGVQRVA